MVNMRSWFRDSDMERFMKDVVGKKLKALLLESGDRLKLEYERRRIIDCDLCEI